MSSPAYPPQIRLQPVINPPHASVRIPGSKSITNRALLVAALAQGPSRLIDPLQSEDTFYMRQALTALGASSVLTNDGDIEVEGLDGRLQAPKQAPLFIGNSGTAVRFLTAACCLTPPGTDVVLDGVARMRERPIRDLLGALLVLGVDAESINGHGCPPVRVRGGGMRGGTCRIRGDISSQFISALLQAAPYAQQDVIIEIVDDLVSKPYVDITRSVMHAFGVEMENDAYRRLCVQSGQRYRGLEYRIEADASNASYFFAAAAVTAGKVTVENVGADSIQGDIRFIEILERMGCVVTRSAGGISVQGPERLQPIHVDMEALPDMAQTLAVVAAFAEGPSRIDGLASLRLKETDRVRAIAVELPKLGARVREGGTWWEIAPIGADASMEASIDTYDDHRMAMSFAVATLRAPGLTINAPGCVAKTFPDFWQRWRDTFGQEDLHG
jgi:3-phosphoshikimate 1-carboxyvinyltransferase